MTDHSKAAFTSQQAGKELRGATHDSSVWSLVLVNGIALALAVAGGWVLVDLMAVYWLQSVIIGISYFFRILGLQRFSTENFKVNDRSVDPTPETKRQTAFFFLFHFGFFHFGYLMFLLSEDRQPWGFGLLICGAAFAINHYFSYRYNREIDSQGTPNIGTLMFTPYIRVVPMHVTIVFGAVILDGAGLLVFGSLKMVADVLMHIVEHRLLAGRASG